MKGITSWHSMALKRIALKSVLSIDLSELNVNPKQAIEWPFSQLFHSQSETLSTTQEHKKTRNLKAL